MACSYSAMEVMTVSHRDDFEVITNNEGQITGFKNLAVTIMPQVQIEMLCLCKSVVKDIIYLEKTVKPKLHIQFDIPEEIPVTPDMPAHEQAKAYWRKMHIKSIKGEERQKLQYDSILTDLLKMLDVLKNFARIFADVYLEIDLDHLVALETEDQLNEALMQVFDVLHTKSHLFVTHDEIKRKYTCKYRLMEQFGYFQRVALVNESNIGGLDCTGFINTNVTQLTCDVTLFNENNYITAEQFEKFQSDNDILTYIIEKVTVFDILYKYESQPLMIAQTLTTPDLPFFMHRKHTIGYMGIEMASLFELSGNTVITRRQYGPYNNGMNLHFSGEHDYYGQLNDSSPISYLFEGDTKPAREI